MASSSSTGSSIGLLVLRLIAGGLLLYGHGWSRLLQVLQRSAPSADPLGLGTATMLGLAGPMSAWFGVFAAVLCAILVIVGFATRFAALPPAVLLGIAAFVRNAHAPFPHRELPLLYLAAFLAIAFTGAGRFALDSRFGPNVSFRGGS